MPDRVRCGPDRKSWESWCLSFRSRARRKTSRRETRAPVGPAPEWPGAQRKRVRARAEARAEAGVALVRQELRRAARFRAVAGGQVKSAGQVATLRAAPRRLEVR